MAILDILAAPHPVLALRARDVGESEFGEALVRLTTDMAETMYAAPGVGLAAPQVGDARRIIVVDPGESEAGPRQLYRMVNPVIVERSDEYINWKETCLSVPDLEVSVKRHLHIRVEWRTPDGERQSQAFHEFEAVIVQHEIDHLEGTVLLDRVSGFRRRRYIQKQKKKKSAKTKAALHAE